MQIKECPKHSGELVGTHGAGEWTVEREYWLGRSKWCSISGLLIFNASSDLMKSDPKKLVEKNQNLIHSDDKKVLSHTQREQGEWILHSLMIEDCEVPFKFKRKDKYQSLKGARVNLTYYPDSETVAGLQFEYMKVVRIKRAW